MSKPRLYLFIGYPGAGKTTIAKIIAEKTGAKHLWADVERHKLFPNPTHSESESNELYARLNAATDYLLARGKSVVFDTNFNHKSDRDKLRAIARKNGVETTIIWVTTPLATAKERAVQSQTKRNLYPSNMSEEEFDVIAVKLEPPSESEKVITIDGTNLDTETLFKELGI